MEKKSDLKSDIKMPMLKKGKSKHGLQKRIINLFSTMNNIPKNGPTSLLSWATEIKTSVSTGIEDSLSLE
jgi:hypothetical protein